MTDVLAQLPRRYRATARRRRRSWLVEVTMGNREFRVTSRHLDQATSAVRNSIADRMHVPKGSVHLDLVVDLPLEVHADIARAREAFQRSSEARARAALVGHTTAALLHKRGLGKRDISVLLGVSPGKAARLLSQYKG